MVFVIDIGLAPVVRNQRQEMKVYQLTCPLLPVTVLNAMSYYIVQYSDYNKYPLLPPIFVGLFMYESPVYITCTLL